MTRPSRGIAPIQEKARGRKVDPRKEFAPKPEVEAMSIKAKIPKAGKLNAMSAGAANSLPMPPAAGLRAAGPGMKKGGMCGGGKAMKGYAKGGKIDGIAQKGHTKGKTC